MDCEFGVVLDLCEALQTQASDSMSDSMTASRMAALGMCYLSMKFAVLKIPLAELVVLRPQGYAFEKGGCSELLTAAESQ